MSRQPELHSYSDRRSFSRLLLLIATLLQTPGVGSPGLERLADAPHHNAVALVRDRLQALAQDLSIDLPNYSAAMLRKDLETLRDYGILERRMYRWGYYLGTGALNRTELAAALNALANQAQVQGDPRLRSMYQQLERRLRGLELSAGDGLYYPVRAQLDRLIIHTDPEEMQRLGRYRETLFERLELLENAIVQGQGLEIYHRVSVYSQRSLGPHQLYPLQLIYHEVAWYLLCEDCQTGHFAMQRLDRLSATVSELPQQKRSQAEQLESLKVANRLLREGWGLFLGEPDEQAQERLGELESCLAKVRFFGEVTRYIVEGERRHPKQRIRQGPKDAGGRLEYVDYSVRLPRRSLPEFFRWVNRFLDQAQVLAPDDWVAKYRERSVALGLRYGD